MSCDACPDDDAISGCDLPDMSLSILADGRVLYNSSANIGGFQFDVDGASVLSASEGAAGDATEGGRGGGAGGDDAAAAA